jgi:hypothetical protein
MVIQTLRSRIQSLKGRYDLWSNDRLKFYPWGFAMNGQTSRLETTRQIIFALKIERIIETGTYRGTTTDWFSQFCLPVETVEINERCYAFSKARFADRENVSVVKSSSIHFLKNKTKNGRLNQPTLFYLDSHWNEHLPLREELELIFGHFSHSVVLIDDFEVPDDPGYRFDNYGTGKALTLEYLEACSLPTLSYFFPSTPSAQETGQRRGWVVLTNNEQMAGSLREIGLLREYHL